MPMKVVVSRVPVTPTARPPTTADGKDMKPKVPTVTASLPLLFFFFVVLVPGAVRYAFASTVRVCVCVCVCVNVYCLRR